MTAAKATPRKVNPAPKSYLDNIVDLVDNVCTGCTECGDRDTCECNFDEDLAFDAPADQQPAESLRPKVVAAKAR
jgi:hypothetical protein